MDPALLKNNIKKHYYNYAHEQPRWISNRTCYPETGGQNHERCRINFLDFDFDLRNW